MRDQDQPGSRQRSEIVQGNKAVLQQCSSLRARAVKILDLKAVLGLGRRFGPRVESDRSGDVSLMRGDLICAYVSGWLSPAGGCEAPDGTGATANHQKRKC